MNWDAKQPVSCDDQNIFNHFTLRTVDWELKRKDGDLQLDEGPHRTFESTAPWLSKLFSLFSVSLKVKIEGLLQSQLKGTSGPFWYSYDFHSSNVYQDWVSLPEPHLDMIFTDKLSAINLTRFSSLSEFSSQNSLETSMTRTRRNQGRVWTSSKVDEGHQLPIICLSCLWS